MVPVPRPSPCASPLLGSLVGDGSIEGLLGLSSRVVGLSSILLLVSVLVVVDSAVLEDIVEGVVLVSVVSLDSAGLVDVDLSVVDVDSVVLLLLVSVSVSEVLVVASSEIVVLLVEIVVAVLRVLVSVSLTGVAVVLVEDGVSVSSSGSSVGRPRAMVVVASVSTALLIGVSSAGAWSGGFRGSSISA